MSKNETNMIRSKQKYGMISQNIMRHPYISASAKAIYAYLAGFAGAENTAFPARDLICYEMDISKDKFYTYMWELQCWNIIEIEKTRKGGGQFSSNLYILDHYPEYVMMHRKEFEENIWPELEKLIDTKKRKARNIKSNKPASEPCPENPDTVKKEKNIAFTPCPEKPDTVQPDTENQDTNNNILNNNILNNNNNNKQPLLKIDAGKDVKLISTEIDITQRKQYVEKQSAGEVVVDNKNVIYTSRTEIRKIFNKQGMIIPKGVINVLENYSVEDITKIAETLIDRKQKGKVINPIGLLIAHTESTIAAILAREFYPEQVVKKSDTKPKFNDPINDTVLFNPEIHTSFGLRNLR